MAAEKVQTLVCATCGTEFQRIVTRGYPPKNCETCKPRRKRSGLTQSEANSKSNRERWANMPADEREERKAALIAVGPHRKVPQHSQATRDKIVESLHDGATLKQAAQIARVSRGTIGVWLQKGRAALDEWAAQVEEQYPAGDPPDDADLPDLDEYGVFALDAEQALGQRNLRWMKALEAGDEKGQGWTRFAWLLERTTPDEFALKEGVIRRLEITGAGGGPVRATSEVQISAVAHILAQAGLQAGPLAQLEEGDARPRAALPAPAPILAESADGIPAAGSLPTP